MNNSKTKKTEVILHTVMSDVQWEIQRINANISILEILKQSIRESKIPTAKEWTNGNAIEGVRFSLIDSLTALENCAESIYDHLYPEQNEGNKK